MEHQNLNETDYCKYDNKKIFTLLASSHCLATLVSTFGASYVTRIKGREASIICGSISFFTGVVLVLNVAAQQNIAMLIIGTILVGVGMGFGNAVVRLYLLEMVEREGEDVKLEFERQREDEDGEEDAEFEVKREGYGDEEFEYEGKEEREGEGNFEGLEEEEEETEITGEFEGEGEYEYGEEDDEFEYKVERQREGYGEEEVEGEGEEEHEGELEQEPRNEKDGIEAKMREFEYELLKIVGLQKLKTQLNMWAKGMLMDEKRRAMGKNLGPRKLPHMAFLGNPGTGKTLVARTLGKLLHSLGVLPSFKVVEVQRSDLVGEYIGETGLKTKKKIKEARGGILFIDEAYRLVPVQGSREYHDYGKEALEEIMSVLEDGQLVVVFAGYTDPMKRLFSSNEGLCRLVTHFFQFDDFTCHDLAEMLMIKTSKQDEKSRLFGFELHSSCTFNAVCEVIEENSTEKLRNKMNGGLVDHMLNKARENLDSRLSFDIKGDELWTITIQDLEGGLQLLVQQVNVD